MYRNTYALINENNLKENVENIILNYPKYDYYFGVVKANAYGHGLSVVNSLIEGGINYLAVSSLDEAIDVRKYNKEIPILCFGLIETCDIDVAIKNNVTITIISYEYYKELLDIKIKDKLKAHVKINTGMNRYGINDKNHLEEIINNLKNTNIYIEGIYTHYATSGVTDIYFDKQTNQFDEIVSLIDLSKIEIVHLYNSLGLVKHDKYKLANGVRLGIVMYGYSSSTGKLSLSRELIFKLKKRIDTKGEKISSTYLSNDLKLKKAFQLVSEISQITYVTKGQAVGYKASYITKEDNFIATIPIGHADGITKYYEYVEINGKKYHIVSFSMDSIMVKVDSKVKVYDKVTLIGDSIPLSNIAKNSEISVHQALVSISNRVPRIHIKGDSKTEIKY